MKSGFDADLLIAEKIMGWEWSNVKWDKQKLAYDQGLRRYSTDIAAAWKVVDKMRELGWPYFSIMALRHPTSDKVGSWLVRFDGRSMGEGEADAPSLTICKVAVLTLESSK